MEDCMENQQFMGSTPTAAKLDVSSVLKRTFATMFKYSGIFFVIAILPALPVELVFAEDSNLRFGANIASVILNAIAAGAAAFAVVQLFKGEPITLKEALKLGCARETDTMIVSVLAGLAILLGLILLIVPGLFLACVWMVVIPVCALENLKAVASMKRCFELTQGHRWHILALLIVGILITLGSALLFAVLLGILLTLLSVDVENYIVDALILSVAMIPGAAFFEVLGAVIYYDLCNIKEGLGLSAAVKVFD
jgi:hypothetical protein